MNPIFRRSVAALIVFFLCHIGGNALCADRFSFNTNGETHFRIENGRLEERKDEDGSFFRWHLNAGQQATLALRSDHPLLMQLRYFDQMQVTFRVLSGSIHELSLVAAGHVSGPRQYKVHQWSLGILTTEKKRWHTRLVDLHRPNWLPWDNPDGLEEPVFLRFECVALEQGTVIDLRNMQLTRNAILLKPDFIPPATWPRLQQDDKGNAKLTLEFHLQNISGRPDTIAAVVNSKHKAFSVVIFPADANASTPPPGAGFEARLELMHAQKCKFILQASLSADAISRLPELYAEPLSISFTAEKMPEAERRWQGKLVKPFSDEVSKQVIEDNEIIQEINLAFDKNDDAVLARIGWPEIQKSADGFMAKELLSLPRGNPHVRNRWLGDWRPASRMPEVVNTKTGDTQFGTSVAGQTWKEYLNIRGNTCENLARAWLYSRKRDYADKGVELFNLYACQYRELSWGNLNDAPWFNGPLLLCSSRIADSSSYGSNWYMKGHCALLHSLAVSGALPNDARQRIYEGFVLPYATELMKFRGGISNMTDITNRNVLLLGLAFGDAALVNWALTHDAGLLSRLRDITPDGFSSEGRPVSYHYAAMDEYIPSLVYLSRSGLDVDYPRERLLEAFRMPFRRAALNGIIPASGDSGRGLRVRPSRLADHLAEMFPHAEWLSKAGMGSTPRAKLSDTNGHGEEWKDLLEDEPRLFPDAGYAILRSGDSIDNQIMVTLDYGRNLFHAALDRNQVTLMAFGRIFSQGVGSSYNIGRGGMMTDAPHELKSFISHDSLGHNVILVDGCNQLPAVGQKLAHQFSDDMQYVVSRVDGISPGVSHTRAVVLREGIVVLIDRVDSAEKHGYDFVYHNLGDMDVRGNWKAVDAAADALSGQSHLYGDILFLQRLLGNGAVTLTWDLSRNLAPTKLRELAEKNQEASPIRLDLWHIYPKEAKIFVGTTGMNNADTARMPDAAPSLFVRSSGKRVVYYTVLAPYTKTSPVRDVSSDEEENLEIELSNGRTFVLSINKLCDAK